MLGMCFLLQLLRSSCKSLVKAAETCLIALIILFIVLTILFKGFNLAVVAPNHTGLLKNQAGSWTNSAHLSVKNSGTMYKLYTIFIPYYYNFIVCCNDKIRYA